ncbi:hypothetical protein D9M68_393500 [compost metagenome]
MALNYEYKSQLEISKAQLDRAINLFLEHEDYTSAITLAGAAEEILAKYLLEEGKLPAYESIKKSTLEGQSELGFPLYGQKEFNHAMNNPRNLLKHRKQDGSVYEDFRLEAKKMLYRAIVNFTRLSGGTTMSIEKYLTIEPFAALPFFPCYDSRYDSLK